MSFRMYARTLARSLALWLARPPPARPPARPLARPPADCLARSPIGDQAEAAVRSRAVLRSMAAVLRAAGEGLESHSPFHSYALPPTYPHPNASYAWRRGGVATLRAISFPIIIRTRRRSLFVRPAQQVPVPSSVLRACVAMRWLHADTMRLCQRAAILGTSRATGP